MRVSLLLLLLACRCLTAAPTQPMRPAEGVVGVVNSLWVVPAEGYAWIDPISVRTVAGGRLFLIDVNARSRDLNASAADAIAYLESHPEVCPGFAEAWRRHDMWFSIGDKDQPRAGPSAGVAFAIVSYSALVGIPIRRDFAVTGEVSRTDGRVLGVGGVEFKLNAAINAGIRTVCIPADGAPPPDTMPVSMAQRLRVVAIRTVPEAFFEAFGYDGPEAERYDRVMSLWRRALEAMARRQGVPARLALDELVEICGNDLSAQRLQRLYGHVDMTQAAENLFADAAQLERDGLPDLALRSARRAWSYADEPLRAQWGAFVRRLEQVNLDPAVRALLQQAESLAAQEQASEAWRLLQRAAQLAPDHPLITAYLQAWKPYEAVSRLEAALAGHPDDTATQIALARALLEARAFRAAATRFAALRDLEPDNPRWLGEQARALAAGRLYPELTAVLRDARDRWADEVARLCAEFAVELDPPTLEISPLQIDGLRATALVRTVDPSGLPELGAWLDGKLQVSLRSSPALLTVDLGQLPPGQQSLRLVSRDRFGNESTADIPIPAGLPVAACLQPGEPPADSEPGQITVRSGTTVAAVGTALRVDAGRLWPGALPRLEQLTAGDQTVAAAPWTLWLPTRDRRPGPWAIDVVGTFAGGEVRRETLTVELTEQPRLWIASPAPGARLTGSTPLTVGYAEGVAVDAEPPAILWVLVDGWPLRQLGPREPAWLPADGLPPGDRTVQAALMTGDGRLLVSPPRTVRVGDEPAQVAPGEPGQPLPTLTLAGLDAPEPAAVPGILSVAAAAPVRLESALPAGDPGPPPAAQDVALRLTGGRLPERLVLAVGDAVAFEAAPSADLLGPQPDLRDGPLATHAWVPRAPGTYPLTLPTGQVTIQVVEHPALEILSPSSGTRLTLPTRLRLRDPGAVGFERVTLLAGDQPLARWAPPLPDVWLEPLLLKPGNLLLRLVGEARGGAVHVSPPVLLRVD